MAQKRKKFQIIIIILLFFVYFLLAARPIPREVILAPAWINSLSGKFTEIQDDDSEEREFNSGAGNLVVSAESIFVNLSGRIPGAGDKNSQIIPFQLGSHFGYFDISGKFILNKNVTNNIYLSSVSEKENLWTEYEAEPVNISVKNIHEETVVNINDARGYPILLDDRIFIISSDQNALSEINKNGNPRWTYEFGAPLTCIDAKAGLLLTGSLDGIIEIFNSDGERIFYFEPDGSRYAIILGCAISSDGSRIGIISGIDQQRFLLLERFGNTGGDYKVVYHEYLNTGFRRPVRILFIDDDQRIVFERSGGIGCYNIKYRRGIYIPLDGRINSIEESGEHGYLFLVTSHGMSEKKLIGIKFPPDRWLPFSIFPESDVIFMKAPFKSNNVFLTRIRLKNSASSMIIVGGGQTLISFIMEDK